MIVFKLTHLGFLALRVLVSFEAFMLVDMATMTLDG